MSGSHAPGVLQATLPAMTPTTLTVRNPDDLLACVPLLLGFVPQESAVVVSLPSGAGPHARADVDRSTDLDQLADSLLAPVLRHGVIRVALVVYAELGLGRQVAAHLEAVFAVHDVEVVAVLAADGKEWVSVRPTTTRPREYDALAHPFVAEAVVRGQVVLGSRDAVRAQLLPDHDLVARVRAAAPGSPEAASPEWVQQCLARHLRQGTLPAADEVGQLLRGVATQDGRDAAWAWVERGDARHHVELWLRVVRGCAPPERAAAAAVLAFHAWLAGDGALAWCAVDASRDALGQCSLTALVEDLLTRAAPPSLWSPLTKALEDDWSEFDVV